MKSCNLYPKLNLGIKNLPKISIKPRVRAALIGTIICYETRWNSVNATFFFLLSGGWEGIQWLFSPFWSACYAHGALLNAVLIYCRQLPPTASQFFSSSFSPPPKKKETTYTSTGTYKKITPRSIDTIRFDICDWRRAPQSKRIFFLDFLGPKKREKEWEWRCFVRSDPFVDLPDFWKRRPHRLLLAFFLLSAPRVLEKWFRSKLDWI